MPIVASQLIAQVSVDGADKAKSDLQGVGDQVNATGGGFKSALGGALSFAAGAAGQALGFLKNQLVDSVKDAMQHQQVMAQTAQAIKSTGDVSGMTAQSIGNLATSLSQVTPFSEDAIQSGENLMLTFTGIGKQTFPQATQAMLDLSKATGEDMKSAALQLGKALNDPTTGMTALSRVGVSFSEAEKQSIQTMMAHNDVAGAQAVMLKELQTEFGGSAKAAGQTFAGQLQILNNTMDDFKQRVGSALLPILQQAMSFVMGTVIPGIERFAGTIGSALSRVDFSDFLAAWRAVSIDIQQIGMAFGNLLHAIDPVSGKINPLADTVQRLAQGGLNLLSGLLWDISAAFNAVDREIQTGQGPFQGLMAVIGQLVPVFRQIGAQMAANFLPAWRQLQAALVPLMPALETIGKILGGVLLIAIGLLVGTITGMAKGIANAIGGIVEIFTGLVQILTGVFNVVGGLVMFFVDLFTGHFNKLGGDLGQIWQGITQIFTGAWNVIAGSFRAVFGLITGYVSGFVQGIVNYFKGLYDTLVGHSIIPDMITGIENWFKRLPAQALGWAKDMISNFVSGIENGVTDIGNAVSQIASTIAAHLHFSKPPLGELSTADTWMPDMMNMLASGMQTNLGKVTTASLSVSQAIAAPLSGGISAIPTSVSQAGTPAQIVIQAPDLYLDGQRVTRALMPYVVTSIRNATGANI